MRHLVRKLLGALERRWLGLRARRLYARGCRTGVYAEARTAWLRLAALEPEGFAPWLHLGLIEAFEGRREASLRHLARAMSLDPEAFRRADLPPELVRAVRQESGGRPLSTVQSAAPTPRAFPLPAAQPPARRTWASDEERARLSGRPPISGDDVAATDIDDLLTRF